MSRRMMRATVRRLVRISLARVRRKNKKKGPAKKKAGKRKAVASDVSNESKDKPTKRMMVFGKYSPGKFAEARKSYIARLRGTCGYREACQRWNNSDEKWELLSEMPHNELVRRRFLPPENPRPRKAC